MNQKQIKDAAKKYADGENLPELLLADGFTKEDADKVIAVIEKEKGKNAKEKEKDLEAQPNDELDLEPFDYTNLSGDDFKNYEKLIESLDWSKSYDFQMFKVIPKRQDRYPGLPGTPVDVVGIELVNSSPMTNTRITAKQVLNLNAQLPNASSAVPCHYYLLKK